MKGAITAIIILAVLVGLYFGYIRLIGKSLNTAPQTDSTESTAAWQKESQDAVDLQQKQRDLIRENQDRQREMQQQQRDRMRDMQRH